MALDPRKLIEAALFVSTDPLSIKELKEISGASEGDVRGIVRELQNAYEAQNSAIEIKKIGKDRFAMQAKDVFSLPLSGLVKPAMSEEALKTLSLIALKQPIAQSKVVRSRGAVTYSHVKELLNKDFISAFPSGRTKILNTTQKFADYFSFPEDLAELKKEMGRQLGTAHQED